MAWAYFHARTVLNLTNINKFEIYGLLFISSMFNAFHFVMWHIIKVTDPFTARKGVILWTLTFFPLSLYLQVAEGLFIHAAMAYCITGVSLASLFFSPA